MLPPAAADGEALRQELACALRKPGGLRAGRRTLGLAASQIQCDHVSKRHFPGCKLGPSDPETQRRTISSLQMKKVEDKTSQFDSHNIHLTGRLQETGTGSVISQPVEMLSSASATRHGAGLCHECPCPARLTPPSLGEAGIPLLRGWGRGMGY